MERLAAPLRSQRQRLDRVALHTQYQAGLSPCGCQLGDLLETLLICKGAEQTSPVSALGCCGAHASLRVRDTSTRAPCRWTARVEVSDKTRRGAMQLSRRQSRAALWGPDLPLCPSQ